MFIGTNISNNIAVDPKVVCHTEHSEVSLFSAFFEILHIRYSLKLIKTSLVFLIKE